MVFKVSTLIVVLAGLATPGFAQFGYECFNATNVEFDCSSYISSFCNMISTASIAPNATAAQCIPLPTGNKSQRLQLRLASSIVDGAHPCERKLSQCQFTDSNGGIESIFWIDPNAGTCNHPELSRNPVLMLAEQ
ncbi:hypothetical protein B0H12DRAFT_1080948 [Mycena haematopus]|nr:hypothetical protein B0H12DRAFT_1080948 [Mycena haematopus]